MYIRHIIDFTKDFTDVSGLIDFPYQIIRLILMDGTRYLINSGY